MNRKINILLFIPKLDGGGAEKQLSLLAIELSKKYTVTIGTFYEGGIWWKRLSKEASIRLVSFKSPKLFKNIKRIFLLYKFIKNEKIDVLQSFLPSSNIIGNLSARLAGLKKCFSGIRSTSITYKGLDNLIVKVTTLIDGVISSILAKKIIYNSYAAMDYHNKICYLESKGTVIFNGYDIKKKILDNRGEYVHEFINDYNNEFIIVCVSNINQKKDHMTLIRALSEINDYRFYCLFVGKIQDQGLFELLKKSISNLDLSNNIIFTDFVDDIDNIYNLSDLVISTSQEESFSNSLVEAMLHNKKIIATNVGENNFLLSNNRGKIVDVGDHNLIAKEIIKVINKKDKINNRIGCRFIRNNFSINKVVNNYERIWELNLAS